MSIITTLSFSAGIIIGGKRLDKKSVANTHCTDIAQLQSWPTFDNDDKSPPFVHVLQKELHIRGEGAKGSTPQWGCLN